MREVRIIEARSGAAGSRSKIRWICLVGCAVALTSACTSGRYATSSTEDQARLTHRELGYSIARPDWAESSDWKSIEVEGADLAYGDASGQIISLSSNCPRTRATPAALARHVTIGTKRTALLAAGPFAVAGAEGWSQSFDTVEDGVALRVKAVTVVAGGCVYDWLLVVGDTDAFDSLEPVFDAWIETFLPPPAASLDETAP